MRREPILILTALPIGALAATVGPPVLLLALVLVVLLLAASAPLHAVPALSLCALVLMPIKWLPVPSALVTLSPPLLALLIGIGRAIHRRTPQPRVFCLTSPVALYLLAIISGWLALGVMLSPNTMTSLGWSLAFLLSLWLPLLFLALIPEARAPLVTSWVALGALLGAFAIVERILSYNPLFDWAYHSASFPLTQHWHMYRVTTTLGHPLTNGAFFVTSFALALASWVRHPRPLLLPATLLSAVGVVLTGSRGAFAGLLVAGLCIVAFRAQTLLPRRAAVALALLVTLGSAGAIYLTARTSSAEAEASAAYRTTALATGLDLASDAPIFGHGPGLAAELDASRAPNGAVVRTLENSWLELAVAVGWPGMLLGVGLAGAALLAGARRRGSALFSAFCGYLVVSASFNLFEGNRPALLLFGLLIGQLLTLPRGTKTESVLRPV